eukprot:TRINITY_DN61252_c0_g1_i1.p1 TRINITY_DN61252_c0_g1~~TRINITY_DN61252_c0_g1_i1.p1  ORF type:complete len:611 (+),score=90.71 TRINITY_DN61252_c0_g1_i1:31-1833(+)
MAESQEPGSRVSRSLSPAGSEFSATVDSGLDACDDDSIAPAAVSLSDIPQAMCVEAKGRPDDIADYVDWALQERAGGWGYFQKRASLLLCWPGVVFGMHALAQIFITAPPHRRRICHAAHCLHDNVLLSSTECGVTPEDVEFLDRQHSVASEFGLVCDWAIAVPMLGTVYFLGFMLGVGFFGSFADRFGRRKACIGAGFVMQFGALLAALSPFFIVLVVARFIVGFGGGGAGLVLFVWNAELMGSSARSKLVIYQSGAFAVGVALLSPIAYLVSAWRWLLIILFAFGLPLFCVYTRVPESPKWLAGPAGRPEEAHKVLCDIATANNRVVPEPPPLPRAKIEDYGGPGRVAGSANGESASLGAQLWDARLFRRFSLMCFSWFAVTLGYYGVSMNVSNLGWSVYTSSLIAALVELPAYPASVWLVDYKVTGRRGTIAGLFMVGGLCCVMTAAAPAPSSVADEEGASPRASVLLLVFIGKAAISGAFGVLYLWAAELFPTDIRSRAVGLQSLCARVGGMLSPLVADLSRIWRPLPLVVCGLPLMAASMMTLTLPETRGKALPDTIDDIQLSSRYRGENQSFREFHDQVDEPTPVGIGVPSHRA